MSVGKPPAPGTPANGTDDDVVELDPAALKAFAHPLRMAILRYLQDHGRATSTTLAEALGESTGQTSYHLRQLAKHRLVEEVRGVGTGRERWWRARRAGANLSTMLADPGAARAATVLLSDLQRERAASLARWFDTLASLSPEDQVASRALHSSATLLLTPEELEQLSLALSEVVDRYAELTRGRFDDDAPEGAVRIRVQVDAFPLVED